MNHTAIVAFDSGADLGLGAIDQMVIADLAPAALFAVPAVDLFALGGEGLAAHPVRVGGGTMDDDLVHGVAGAALKDYRPSGRSGRGLNLSDRATLGRHRFKGGIGAGAEEA